MGARTSGRRVARGSPANADRGQFQTVFEKEKVQSNQQSCPTGKSIPIYGNSCQAQNL
jgi:hypothetical protein